VLDSLDPQGPIPTGVPGYLSTDAEARHRGTFATVRSSTRAWTGGRNALVHLAAAGRRRGSRCTRIEAATPRYTQLARRFVLEAADSRPATRLTKAVVASSDVDLRRGPSTGARKRGTELVPASRGPRAQARPRTAGSSSARAADPRLEPAANAGDEAVCSPTLDLRRSNKARPRGDVHRLGPAPTGVPATALRFLSTSTGPRQAASRTPTPASRRFFASRPAERAAADGLRGRQAEAANFIHVLRTSPPAIELALEPGEGRR